MLIQLITLASRTPEWINTGFQTYAERLPRDYQLQLIELPLPKRHKSSDINALKQQEAEQVLKVIPAQNAVLALDEHGQQWDTPALANRLQQWHDDSCNLSLIIGGPDGLADACYQRADQRWSLSKLTLPHPLVRVVVAEQIYRAWSILTRHPYHRV